jgi:hypothetical protein
MDLIMFALIAGVALLGLTAPRWGVDSRELTVDPRISTSANGIV